MSSISASWENAEKLYPFSPKVVEDTLHPIELKSNDLCTEMQNFRPLHGMLWCIIGFFTLCGESFHMRLYMEDCAPFTTVTSASIVDIAYKSFHVGKRF